ncbi:hypothetical protein RMATCC62417_13236 [Rhizopus microsporus]|nr:hypothetical protein RMATCC62417_13236 [Rhizopus microsporus]
MIADFINYTPDTTIEEVDDESSLDEMDLEYTAKEYGEVIMLADAFTTTIDDNDNANNKIIMFFELITEEGYTVPKAAEIAGIPRSCVKRESKKNLDKLKGNTKLEDKHTFFLMELIDKNPCITVMEAKEDLCSKFSDLSITASGATGVDYMANCVFMDESGFNAHQIRKRAWSRIGEPVIVTVSLQKGMNLSRLNQVMLL